MKTIPAVLLSHKAQPVTTLCRLWKVGPLPDDSFRYFTDLDANVTYDDGTGPATYKARTGFQMSAIVSTNDLGVDNAEAESLVPLPAYVIEGFTQAQVDSGALDKTPFVVYEINYRDLTAGRHEVIASGTIGETRTRHGVLTVLEMRSLSELMKQNIVELDSLTCRAPFGSVTGVDKKHGCDYDLSAEWVTATVTAVGAESDRIFTASSLGQADDYFAPGLVEWLTGDNAGQQREVDSFAGGQCTLRFSTVHPVQEGDAFRVRRDCTKRWTGHNSCDTFWGSQKPLHFRGEPHIPVADTGVLNTPGAGVPSTIHGTGETIQV